MPSLRRRFMLLVRIVAFLSVATIIERSPAFAAESLQVLDAIDACPATQPACLEVYGYLRWRDEDLSPVMSPDLLTHPALIAWTPDGAEAGAGVATLRVHGRLNGGDARVYGLRLLYPQGEMRCHDFRIAALGSVDGGGGTILTRQGTLEILSAEFEIGARSSLQVFDDRTGAVANHVTPGWERYDWSDSLAITPQGQVVWRNGERCLDLNSGDRFRLADEQACRSAGTMRPSTEAEIRFIENLGKFDDAYIRERLPYDLNRLEGTPFLIYIWSVACT